jgi:hypothetical protein
MDRLRRIAIGVCVCAVLGGLAASSAAATMPSLLLVGGESKKAVPVGGELLIGITGEPEVTTKTGTASCLSLMFTGHVTSNGGRTIQIELQGSQEQNECFGSGAMPFASSSYLWSWGNFPFNHSFGEIVMKPKGKSQTSGSAELHPSPSTSDLVAFSATEGGLTRECFYSIKKLKGSWFSQKPTRLALEKGDKLKSNGSENEASCPKTATIPIKFEMRVNGSSGREPTEVLVV